MSSLAAGCLFTGDQSVWTGGTTRVGVQLMTGLTDCLSSTLMDEGKQAGKPCRMRLPSSSLLTQQRAAQGHTKNIKSCKKKKKKTCETNTPFCTVRCLGAPLRTLSWKKETGEERYSRAEDFTLVKHHYMLTFFHSDMSTHLTLSSI